MFSTIISVTMIAKRENETNERKVQIEYFFLRIISIQKESIQVRFVR